MAGEKVLTIRPGALDDAARADYAKALRFDTSGGLASLDGLLAGAELFDVLDGDRLVLRYALRVVEFSHGSQGEIVAAVGRCPGLRLVDAFLPVIERQLAGVDAVKVTTKRKGLAAKLMQHGYQLDGFILRKKATR